MAHKIVKEWKTKAGPKAYVLLVHNTHYCGYVGIDKNHPWFEDNYNKHDDINVHGGLTFSDKIDDIDEPWLFGFDAAHLGDTLENINVDYMARECEKLAKQIQEGEQ